MRLRAFGLGSLICGAGLLLTACGADQSFVPPGCDDELAAGLNEIEHYAELETVGFVSGEQQCAGAVTTMDEPPDVVEHYVGSWNSTAGQ